MKEWVHKDNSEFKSPASLSWKDKAHYSQSFTNLEEDQNSAKNWEKGWWEQLFLDLIKLIQLDLILQVSNNKC